MVCRNVLFPLTTVPHSAIWPQKLLHYRQHALVVLLVALLILLTENTMTDHLSRHRRNYRPIRLTSWLVLDKLMKMRELISIHKWLAYRHKQTKKLLTNTGRQWKQRNREKHNLKPLGHLLQLLLVQELHAT